MKLLIDADILLFRMCFSHERTIDWGDGVESKVTDLPKAKDRITRMVYKMVKHCHCTEPIMCLTGRKNFRYNVYPDYKANRKYHKFEMIKPLRAWIVNNFSSLCIQLLEADDVMGIKATASPDEYVIATIDKDLLQIPGRHYNWGHNKKSTVTKYQGDRLFYTQILAGDVTDNYFGVPGIGPVKANQILSDNPKDKWWPAIVEAYESKQLSEEYALQMARVARILRVEDYNFELEEPLLWTPKQNEEKKHE